MQKNASFYDFTQTLQGMMFQAGMQYYEATTPPEHQLAEMTLPAIMHIRRGYAESFAWMMVQLYEFYPEALTVDAFRVRAVYSAPRLSQGLLELIASEGWAHRVGEAYQLTPAGYEIIHAIHSNRNQKFNGFVPIDDAILQELVTTTERIFESAVENHPPDVTWCLRHSQQRKPNRDEVSAIAYLIHLCSDFNAWRDDAHMQAYGEYDVDGRTWEAFSFVVTGAVQSADGLFEQLAYRGWTQNEWQASLDDLTERGWLSVDGDTYRVTDDGLQVHQTVEVQTDDLFFGAWDSLTPQEQADYIGNLHVLEQACQDVFKSSSVD